MSSASCNFESFGSFTLTIQVNSNGIGVGFDSDFLRPLNVLVFDFYLYCSILVKRDRSDSIIIRREIGPHVAFVYGSNSYILQVNFVANGVGIMDASYVETHQFTLCEGHNNVHIALDLGNSILIIIAESQRFSITFSAFNGDAVNFVFDFIVESYTKFEVFTGGNESIAQRGDVAAFAFLGHADNILFFVDSNFKSS